MKPLKLSPTLEIKPEVFATQGNAILGLRKSGKSYSATFLAEQLMECKIPFTAFDPIGVWRNLKLPGTGRGFPVVVVGDDADLPLNQKAIPDIIRAAMREGVNLVIDLYSIKLSKADWRAIVEQAVTIMLHENRSHGMRHIFLEEAAEFVPQIIRPDQAKVYSVMEKLARMGGNASLGYTLINQRAEAINKELLENCDMVFLHKQRGRNSVANLSKWLKAISPKTAEKVEESLPNLKSGECWILTSDATDFEFVRMPQKQSFHPDRENPLAVKPSGKSVDVSTWISRLSESIKKHEEKPTPAPAKEVAPKIIEKPVEVRVEVPVFTEKEVKTMADFESSLRDNYARMSTAMEMLEEIRKRVAALKAPPARPVLRPVAATHTPKQRFIPTQKVSTDSDTKIEGGLRRMMIALAQRPCISAAQLGVRAGLSSTSGTFGTYLSKGRSSGWIDGDRHSLALTPEGEAALGEYTPLPTGQELLAYWLNELEGGARRMLEVLAEAYPNELTGEQVGGGAGISPTSGTFGTYLSKLRTLELVSGKRDALKASDEFFE